MNTSPVPVCGVHKRYLVQLSISISCYMVVLFISLKLMREVPSGWPQVLVAVAPTVPIAFVLLAIIRMLSHIDEMQRRIHLEAVAMAGGVTAFLSLTYGLLENAGVPKLSAFWTFFALDILWAMFVFILQRKYR